MDIGGKLVHSAIGRNSIALKIRLSPGTGFSPISSSLEDPAQRIDLTLQKILLSSMSDSEVANLSAWMVEG